MLTLDSRQLFPTPWAPKIKILIGGFESSQRAILYCSGDAHTRTHIYPHGKIGGRRRGRLLQAQMSITSRARALNRMDVGQETKHSTRTGCAAGQTSPIPRVITPDGHFPEHIHPTM